MIIRLMAFGKLNGLGKNTTYAFAGLALLGAAAGAYDLFYKGEEPKGYDFNQAVKYGSLEAMTNAALPEGTDVCFKGNNLQIGANLFDNSTGKWIKLGEVPVLEKSIRGQNYDCGTFNNGNVTLTGVYGVDGDLVANIYQPTSTVKPTKRDSGENPVGASVSNFASVLHEGLSKFNKIDIGDLAHFGNPQAGYY